MRTPQVSRFDLPVIALSALPASRAKARPTGSAAGDPAPRVDHILQFCEFGIWRTAFQINDAPHIVEAGAYTVFNGEEAAQIERSFKRDGNAFERNAKRGGVGPVSIF